MPTSAFQVLGLKAGTTTSSSTLHLQQTRLKGSIMVLLYEIQETVQEGQRIAMNKPEHKLITLSQYTGALLQNEWFNLKFYVTQLHIIANASISRFRNKSQRLAYILGSSSLEQSECIFMSKTGRDHLCCNLTPAPQLLFSVGPESGLSGTHCQLKYYF